MASTGFWKLAAEDPERIALIGPDDDAHTAGELLAASNRIANGLRALGLHNGDTVAAVLPNGLEMVELYLAALQIGLYLTPINHHLVGPEIAYIVGDSGAKVFVTHGRFADEATAAVKELGFPEEASFAVAGDDGVVPPGFRPFEELGAGQPDTPPPDRSAGATMHYTSGTTGKPKGVKRGLYDIDPDDMATLVGGFLAMFGALPHDGSVHLVGSPLYHTAVLMCMGCSLAVGHSVVLMDKWGPELMLEKIDRYGVTSSHMVPTQFHRMLALPEDVRAKYDCSTTRTMIHAAAPCPPDVKRRMIEWWGNSIWEYYAATEGGGSIVSAEEWLEKPGTVGKAWPSSELRILDDEGAELPVRGIGTVYMALGMADFEYKDDQEKTNANRRDGFFTVGDIGYLDEDGYLFLCDRKSDMIISGGVNIYPAEIESVLLTHPKVGDAAVFGIPHPDWGEEIKAVIEPAEGIAPDQALADELHAWCQGQLARFKQPRTIDFVAELPRDPNGKLYKRKLRDPYWEGQERAI